MEVQEHYMRLAMQLAAEAAEAGEVPVGAIVVRRRDGAVVGCGRNCRESAKNALCHAELIAIDEACRTLAGWRLFGCDLYVTLEPCPMCAGAIINSRIESVVFGAYDAKAGSCGSVVDLFTLPYNHFPTAQGGVLEGECAEQLSAFFKALRAGSARRQVGPEVEQAPSPSSPNP